VEQLKKDTKTRTPSTLQQNEKKEDKQEKNSTHKKNGSKTKEAGKVSRR
jgi:hypothetical protein